ncbi:MAG: sugar phosphate isomerase/epimerase family protein [Candidatus Hodarchaeota archaeon]
MKFSTTITNPNIIEKPLEVILDALVDAGFDAIDVPGEPSSHPISKIKPILDSYSDKIKIGELTACINPTRDLINQDPVMRRKAIDYIKYCIEAAEELGCNLTHLCFITNDDNLNNTPRAKLEARAIDAIKECSSLAGDLGVKLMIEPLFKDDNTILNTAKQGVNLFAKALDIDAGTFIQGDQFGLLLDIFHMHHEEKDLLKTLGKYATIMFHGHVADHPRGLDFTRDDSIFVKKAIRRLDAIGYKSLVSFESFDPSVTLEALKDSLSTIKSFLN